MKNTEYAIVDIETTGGNASGSRITEIAIIIHDGKNVLDRYETLVNPEQDIPLSIFGLTGINNEMVANAPIFDDISEKVLEMLTDRIFVAHNVNFDYLGNLCNSLNISLENRHRAGGDADATALLFSLLLEWDDAGEIEKMIKKTAQDQRLPPNLPPDDFNNLPDKPGVYYFYNQAKKVIYVGKAINLKKRVASHFSGNNINPQRQHFLRDIHGISFEVCATELMALLLECTEIKKLWPTYNRALKRFEAKFGIYQYEARNGYKYLAIGKVSKFQVCIHEFSSLYEGINLLRSLAERFEIDHRFCKYARPEEGEFFHNNNVQSLPDVIMHNTQVDNAIDYLLNNRPTFAIIDKGKSKEERSCVWIENGHFYGMGYLPSDISIHEPSEVKNYVTPYKSNQYIEHLIFSYAEKHPRKVFFKNHFMQ
jgi:DNA polymerase-3 subunit epsilon